MLLYKITILDNLLIKYQMEEVPSKQKTNGNKFLKLYIQQDKATLLQ